MITLIRIVCDRYSAAMHPAIGIALFLLTVAPMEGVAYAAHRWVMRGPRA